jgi:hypothetical protein
MVLRGVTDTKREDATGGLRKVHNDKHYYTDRGKMPLRRPLHRWNVVLKWILTP